MPSKKEDLALRWEQKSEEEKNLIRKKNKEKVRLSRAKKPDRKRSEMNSDELSKVREKDKMKKKMRRMKMSEEQKSLLRQKDRERKAKGTKKKEERKKERKEKKVEKEKIDMNELEKKKMKQLSNNCKTQQKIEAKRTEAEQEEIQVEKVRKMRETRSKMTLAGKELARIRAKLGLREHRRFGYLREYKQRKRRSSFDPDSWKKEPHALSNYFKMLKESETDMERKEELKRMNRIRVEKHRMKMRKILLEPVIIKDYGEKSEYELLREKNIKEFERLKKDSGLFD